LNGTIVIAPGQIDIAAADKSIGAQGGKLYTLVVIFKRRVKPPQAAIDLGASEIQVGVIGVKLQGAFLGAQGVFQFIGGRVLIAQVFVIGGVHGAGSVVRALRISCACST